MKKYVFWREWLKTAITLLVLFTIQKYGAFEASTELVYITTGMLMLMQSTSIIVYNQHYLLGIIEGKKDAKHNES